MSIKFSQTWNAVRKRIASLPKIIEGTADAMRKRDAYDLVARWRAGLKDGTLRLDPLRPRTVRVKAKRGQSKPSSPLYGRGLDGNWTYVKGMQVHRTRNGYRVAMAARRHHSSKLNTRQLFQVHEYGALIRRGGHTIRIPPRPAMAVAYRDLVRAIARRDDNRKMQAVAMEFLLTGGSRTHDAALEMAASSEARNGR